MYRQKISRAVLLPEVYTLKSDSYDLLYHESSHVERMPLSISRISGRVIKKEGICLRTAASLIMARFDNPLSLMFGAEGVQITGGGTIVKDIFTENRQ